MLRKPVEPVEVPIEPQEQQAPSAANDCAKRGDKPPDPIDPGRKEPVVKPVQSATPKPVESPLRDYVDDMRRQQVTTTNMKGH